MLSPVVCGRSSPSTFGFRRLFPAICEACGQVTISVVTATYNAVAQLPRLIASLRAQTDKDFEWVVADGGSTDGTLVLLKNTTGLKVVISSQPDCGIYDALNRAIRMSSGEYYVVIGADDQFSSNAIADFRKTALESGADIVAARVTSRGHMLRVREGKTWRYGAGAFIASHSVGTLFRKALHERFGFYSRKLTITADSLFVKQACLGGAKRCAATFTAGEFSAGGASTADIAGALFDLLRVQLLTGENKLLQIVLFVLRLIKHYKRI
jgi:hypothetical protein